MEKEKITKEILSSIESVKLGKILTELLAASEEHIRIGGLRFNGVHDNKIKQIFEKHGCKFVQPF